MSVAQKPVFTRTADDLCLIDRTNRRLVTGYYPSGRPLAELRDYWVALAKAHDLGKVWIWSYLPDLMEFLDLGFKIEGTIIQDGGQPPVSLAYFLDSKRACSRNVEMEDQILYEVSISQKVSLSPIDNNKTLRLLNPVDSPAISNILGEVFTTYPSPVKDPLYIQKLMSNGCLFSGAFDGNKLISVAAAYPDRKLWRCEITDCATLPDYRGQSLTTRLIQLLELEVCQSGKYRLFSLARSLSYGMNRVFYRLGYRYQGRLINNCDIAGGFEDMNLWLKY